MRAQRKTAHVSLLLCAGLAAGCSLDEEGMRPEAEIAPDASSVKGPRMIAADRPSLRDGGAGDAAVVPGDAGALARGPDAGEPAMEGGSACQLGGRFAVHVEADVQWQGTTLAGLLPVINPGVGKFDFVVLSEFSPTPDGRLSSTIRACSSSVPDFLSSIGETYGVYVENKTWDRVQVRWTTRLSPACSLPGCRITSDLIVAQMGLSVSDSSGWPAPGEAISSTAIVDDDSDGEPGITGMMRGPQAGAPIVYSHPPTSYLLDERVGQMMLALRLSAELTGRIESCDAFSGTVPRLTLDTRALGCRLDSGKFCNAEQTAFGDSHLPFWAVQAATFRAVRLPSGADCAAARASVTP